MSKQKPLYESVGKVRLAEGDVYVSGKNTSLLTKESITVVRSCILMRGLMILVKVRRRYSCISRSLLTARAGERRFGYEMSSRVGLIYARMWMALFLKKKNMIVKLH